MALFWWQWILIFLFGIALLFFYLSWFGFIVFLKFLKTNPRIEGIWYSDDGKIKEKRGIKQTEAFGSEWRLLSSNPTKVKFKVLARGIGKAEDKEWDISDFIETQYADGDRRLVEFNLMGRDVRYALSKKMWIRDLQHISAENALNLANYLDLKRNFDAEVEKYAMTAKKLIAFQPSKKSKTER